MKTLSPNTARMTDHPVPSPILLATTEFTSPSALTMRQCSASFGDMGEGVIKGYNTFKSTSPLGFISVKENIIEVNSLSRDVSVYLYRDFGISHFDDFTHNVDFNVISMTGSTRVDCSIWAIANTINDVHSIYSANEDLLYIGVSKLPIIGNILILLESIGGTVQSDYYVINFSTDYYLTIQKNKRLLSCAIYSDSARSSLLNTLSLTLISDKTFRYLYAMSSYNFGISAAWTGTISNLSLDESMDINIPGSFDNQYDSNHYDPLIESWSPIRCGEISHKDYSTMGGDLSLTIQNNIPCGGYDRFSGVLNAFDYAFATVTLTLIHEGAMDPGDGVNIFKGLIDNPESMDRAGVTLKISDVAVSFLKKWPHTIVNATDYAGADPDDIGKMLAQVWGSCKRVPFRAVDAGGVTTLGADLAAAATTVIATDTTAFPASGTIQIDVEQITYTGKTATSFTGCTRGAGATTDVAHDLGANIAEIQSSYFYILGHAVKAINAVYVSDILQPAALYTAYTGQTGDQHGTYGALAVIEFTTLPVIEKQVNVTVGLGTTAVDLIDLVTDANTLVGDDVSALTATPAAGSAEYTLYPSGTTNNGWLNPANIIDGNGNTYGDNDHVTDRVQMDFTEPSPGPGTCVSQRFYAICSGAAGGETVKVDKNNGATNLTTWTMTTTPSEYNVDVNSTNWITNIEFDDPSAAGVRIHHAWKIIKYTPTVTMGGQVVLSGDPALSKTNDGLSGTPTLTGNSVADTVIGSQVTADVDGYQDDASGTYTGTPNALIERPDHILKHILIAILGLTSSDLDSTTYDESGTQYNTNSFALGVCLLDPPKAKDVIHEIAYQSKSLEFWEAGIHHLIYIASTVTTDKVFSGFRMDLNQLWIEKTMRSEIENEFTGLYDRHWDKTGTDAYRLEVTSTHAVSQAKPWGVLQGNPIELDFITTSGQAQAVLDWIRDDWALPRTVINLIGDPSFTEMERGDLVEFDVTEVNLNAALLGLVSSGDQFRILDKIYLPNFKQQIKMISI